MQNYVTPGSIQFEEPDANAMLETDEKSLAKEKAESGYILPASRGTVSPQRNNEKEAQNDPCVGG